MVRDREVRQGSASSNPWSSAPASGSLPRSAAGACLNLAAELGFEVPAVEPVVSRAVQDSLTYVQQQARLAALQAQEAEQLHTQQFGTVADAEHMRARAVQLQAATGSLHAVVEHKAALVRLLQQPCSSASLAVENEHQAAFGALLERAAAAPATLAALQAEVQWALEFDQAPSCWPRMLRPLLDAADTCQQLHAGMRESESSVSTLTASRVLSSIDGLTA